MTGRSTRDLQPVPIIVGVVGHRNLVASEIPRIREIVRKFFEDLREQFPELPLIVMNPLAEGADRLIAHEAIEMGIPLIVPIPLPVSLYVDDFSTSASREEFEQLCAQSKVIELPILRGNSEANISAVGSARDRQYAQLGVFISAHSHIMLALWDGKPGDQLGGTGQVVEFHHYDKMEGYIRPELFRSLLADDESDLVFHIVCSRDSPDGDPEPPLRIFETSWYTTNEVNPRSQSIPDRYQRIFARTSEFNRDYSLNSGKIEAEQGELLTQSTGVELSFALRQIDELFMVADYLAGHFQKRFNLMLRAIHLLAVMMGLAFIAYSDVAGYDSMLYAFLGFFGAGAFIFSLAHRNAWQRKYLDYRALAEGLRVQFFWAAAGVSVGEETKFTHDNFLQKQEVELGWIRNVMRVAGVYADVESRFDQNGLQLALKEWVGDSSSGQTGYYATQARVRALLHSRTQRIGSVCLWATLLVVLVLAILHGSLTEQNRNVLIVLMGILPLIAATRDAYAHKKAEKELIKQYRFMHRVFRNAQKKLAIAETDSERREILRALGEAALDEHAEWILMHRERPLEMGRL
jgi:hypothetical protein